MKTGDQESGGRHVVDMEKVVEERSRLYTAIEQLTDSVIITDTDGVIQYVNPGFERSTGYTKGEVLGQNPRILKSDKYNPSFYEKMWGVLLQGEVWHGNLVNKRKDGSLFEEAVTISPVTGSDGTTVSYVSVSRNVTHEAALQKAKEYFTFIASHELRTPLTKLGLFKELIGKVFGGDKQSEEATLICSGLDETYHDFERIISAATLFSSYHAAGSKKTEDPIYIRADLMSNVDKARHMVRDKQRDINIELNIDALQPDACAAGDQFMANKVFEELLSNAIKYTPDGRSVKVSGKVDGNHIIVEIIDEGVGISKERIEQVFEPYFSLESPLKHSSGRYNYKGGGLGLGLTVARFIMESNGGGLELLSAGEGKGTTVILRFPVFKR